jgi:hypothetical protein
VIRAVLHLINDQPLVVELDETPQPGDVSLICRNVRTPDGKRPVFIDHSSSTFVFPYASIRFVEIPVVAAPGETEPPPSADESAEADLEIDEDFLRRVREA